MAILALADGPDDLRERVSRIVVGSTRGGEPVTVAQLGVQGALMTLLHQTVMPNLVQTLEGQPCLVHAGPFGNIAHGCSSILADKLALGYADYVITEAGFASDLGFEKFMHIKTRDKRPAAPRRRAGGLGPGAEVARQDAPPRSGQARC